MDKIDDETRNWLQEPLPTLGMTEQDPSTRQGDPFKHLKTEWYCKRLKVPYESLLFLQNALIKGNTKAYGNIM